MRIQNNLDHIFRTVNYIRLILDRVNSKKKKITFTLNYNSLSKRERHMEIRMLSVGELFLNESA